MHVPASQNVIATQIGSASEEPARPVLERKTPLLRARGHGASGFVGHVGHRRGAIKTAARPSDARAVLDAVQALFLDRHEDLSSGDDRRGAVVAEVDAEVKLLLGRHDGRRGCWPNEPGLQRKNRRYQSRR